MDEQRDGDERSRQKAEDVYGEIPAFPARNSGKTRVSLGSIFKGEMPDELRVSMTFSNWFGANLLVLLLLVICLFALSFMVAWVFTRPDLQTVQTVLGAGASPQEVMNVLKALQQEHLQQFRDLFGLIVQSGLVPLFTLLAGYVFGSRQQERSQ